MKECACCSRNHVEQGTLCVSCEYDFQSQSPEDLAAVESTYERLMNGSMYQNAEPIPNSACVRIKNPLL